MEDLKDKGFVMVDRVKQLDFDHCRLYMEAAASLHAVSFAVHKENPELIESIGQDVLYSDAKLSEMFKTCIKYGFEKLADFTSKTEKFKKYSELLKDVSVNLWDKIDEVLKPRSELNTLTQGDPWITNMMFKYDDKGTVIEVKLLDFQGLRYTCSITDVVFFIWSSASHDVRRNRLNDLYNIYIDAFNLKLQEINCSERMIFEKFMDIIEELSYYVIYMVGTSIAFFCNPNPVDVGSFFDKESVVNPFDSSYTDNFRNNHLPKYLEEAEIAGVFEYLEKHKN